MPKKLTALEASVKHGRKFVAPASMLTKDGAIKKNMRGTYAKKIAAKELPRVSSLEKNKVRALEKQARLVEKARIRAAVKKCTAKGRIERPDVGCHFVKRRTGPYCCGDKLKTKK